MNKKIVTLTGFMGCGKTHVSKILAEELGFDVIDSDKEIEKVKKKTNIVYFDEVQGIYFFFSCLYFWYHN